MREIKPGDLVRSFDFNSRDLSGPHACYIEGRVERVGVWMEGCPRYEILVTRDIFAGEEGTDRLGITVLPPLNGTKTLFGHTTNFVELMEE